MQLSNPTSRWLTNENITEQKPTEGVVQIELYILPTILLYSFFMLSKDA